MTRRINFKRLALVAAGLTLFSGCSQATPDCVAFNKTFDELQMKQAQAAVAIVGRGICHSREEKDRQEKCPEYLVWLTAATNYVNFVATDESGCTNEADRKNALADLAELAKPGAFPKG